ncbi:hypothetical protein QUF50_08030 [Thiotrichales bacterium HSG1]|nr:hypothetical protein [Thiotrichales bacterium HSG1]
MTKDDTNDYYNYDVEDRQERLIPEEPLPPRKKLFRGLEHPIIPDILGLFGLLGKRIYALASVRKRHTENLAHTPVHYTTALAHVRKRYTENLAHTPVHYTTALAHIRPRYTENLAHTPVHYTTALAHVRKRHTENLARTPVHYTTALAHIRPRYTENLAHTPVQGIEPLVDIPENTYMNRRKQRYHFEW